MRIAVVEDQIFWQEEIKSRIYKRYGTEAEVYCFCTGTEFLNELKCYDILFMDIELGMEKEDGFLISQKYKLHYRDTILIILTTHIELCSKGYQVEAFRYIDKTKQEEIDEALESAYVKLIKHKKVSFHIVGADDIQVKVKDILYIETYGRNLNLHTEEGAYECVGNITSQAEKLKDYGMFLIHRSYLVNFDAISLFGRKTVTLKNDEKIEVSRKRCKELKKDYFEWKFKVGNG